MLELPLGFLYEPQVAPFRFADEGRYGFINAIAINMWEPSDARQRLDKHLPTVTKLLALQRKQYRFGANILVTQDINNETRRFLCKRNKVI
jgi:hypothetical protein